VYDWEMDKPAAWRFIWGCAVWLAIVMIALIAIDTLGLYNLILLASLASPVIGAGFILVTVRAINRRQKSRHKQPPDHP